MTWNYKRAASIARRKDAGETFSAIAKEMGVTPPTIRAAYLRICRSKKAGETWDQVEQRLDNLVAHRTPANVHRVRALLEQTRKRLILLAAREARLVAQLSEMGWPDSKSDKEI